MKKQVTHKSFLKRIAAFLCFSSFACLAPNAWAKYASFDANAMSLASGFTGGTVSGWTMTVDDASKLVYVAGDSNDSLNRSARGWYAGVTIKWPEGGSRDDDASMQTSRMSGSVAGDGDLSGTTLTRTTEKALMQTCMETTTWWGYITPEDAYALKTGNFETTLTMSGSNYALTYGVDGATFTIKIPVDSLELKDEDGIVWFPAVATNAAGKVYGDLNVALKEGNTIVPVTDAAITQAITNGADLVFIRGSFNITGLENLTLNGGSYDFDPAEAGCTIAQGYKVQKEGGVWNVVLDHVHGWKYEVATNDNVVTLIATCTNKNCNLSKPYQTKATLTLSEGDKSYDGKAITAELAKDDDFETLTGITLGDVNCTGSATDVGEYKFSVAAEGTDCDFGKSVTISQRDIADATITLSNTSLIYNGADQTVTISSVKIGDLGVAYEEDAQSSVLTAKAIGTYTVKVNGTGNFTGSATTTWQIQNTTGSIKESAVVGTGIKQVSNTFFTLDDSTQLEYGDPDTWWATIKVSFNHSSKDYTLTDYGYATYTSPYVTMITVDGVTVSAHDIAQVGVTNFQHSIASAGVGTGSYNYSLREGSRDYYYVDYIQFKVGFSLGEVQTAAAGTGKLTWTMNLGAINYDGSQAIEFNDYVIEIPVKGKDFALFNPTTGEQRYPEHQHNWSDLTVEGNAVTSICQNADCAIKSLWTRLDIANKVYDGNAIAGTIVKSEGFDTYYPGTVGTIKYYAADQEISAPKYTGDYTAKLTVSNVTISVPFKITKPVEGYTDGWEVNCTESTVRYDSWEEALAAANDGDIIYYRDGDRDYEEHEFSIGAKNLTIDFAGATLTKSAYTTMTIKNSGSGVLTLQNVTIKQPRFGLASGQIETEGNIVFGDGVQVDNTAEQSGNYCTITVNSGALIVSNGCYQCGFTTEDGATLNLAGGKYWENDKPAIGQYNVADHVCREIEGDYKYEIVEHVHAFTYTANANVITCDCTGEGSETCYWHLNQQSATLTANDAQETAEPYAGASVAYSEFWIGEKPTITYWQGETPLDSAPTKFGDYTAKITVGGATAEASFKIIHNHVFAYDKDDAAGTITARCTATADCDFNTNKRVVTLVVENGTYNGAEQALVNVTTNSVDFPANVVLTYDCEGLPKNAGDYVATMIVGGVSVNKNFSIAQADITDATVTLSPSELYYTTTEQSVSVASVLVNGTEAKDFVTVSGVTKATAMGTYTLTVTANDSNFKGSKDVTWQIKNTTGSIKDSAVVGTGIKKVSDTSFTLDDSTQLEYGDTDTWWATIKVSFSHSSKDYTLTDYGYATYTSPNAVKVTVDGVTVSAHDIAQVGVTNFQHSIAMAGVGTDSYKYSLVDGSRDYYYTDYIMFKVGFSLGEVQTAAAGTGKLTWTMNLGAINYDGSQAIEFKDYVIEIPVTGESFVLFNPTTGEQRYPEHQHNWSELTVEGNAVTSICQNVGCAIKSLWTRLDIADKVYDGTAIAGTIVKSEGFDIYFPGTVGTIKYYAADQEISAPKYTGDYTAKLTVSNSTISVPFKITKPVDGYTDGWEVNCTESTVRYDTWEEALAAAQDGDTIYYRNGNIDQRKIEFTVSKDITLDCGGATFTYTGTEGDMEIYNNGTGKLTLQNVLLVQPVYGTISKTYHNISLNGGDFVLGTNFMCTQKKSDFTINVVGVNVAITSGIYQCAFELKEEGAKVEISGGNYLYTDHCKPQTSMLKSGYVVVTKTLEGYGDYYTVVPHEHDYYYEQNGNVITLKCKGEGYEGCAWTLNENKLTLTASDALEGSTYTGATYVHDESFLLDAEPEIEYYQDGVKVGTPSAFGSYEARVTVTYNGNSATAVAAFNITHVHKFKFDLDSNTLTATCTNKASTCDIPECKTNITLTVTGGSDGVAPTFAIENMDAFLAIVNRDSQVASIGEITTVRTTSDGAAYNRWYVGNYRSTCVVTADGVEYTLTKDFSIDKPEAGYTSGWEVGSTGIRYLESDISIAFAAANDGDIIYYRDGDRDFEEHEFSIGDKNLTIDFAGATLTKSAYATMTIKNSGSGVLTLQNVTIKQPRGTAFSAQIETEGNIVFGAGVKVENTASSSSNYCTITVNSGALIVSNGCYQCGFATDGGTLNLAGGKYWEHDKPAIGQYNVADHVCREIEGDYKYEIVEHVHAFTYTADANVITCDCAGEGAETCFWHVNQQTATLTATDAQETAEPYAGASVAYTEFWLGEKPTITYWQGETPLDGAPIKYGDYTAKITVGGVTAEASFQIIHTHHWSYKADGAVITAVCTNGTCTISESPTATLNVVSQTNYTGAVIEPATFDKGTDFEGDAVISYEPTSPINVGTYTAFATIDGVVASNTFAITQADIAGISAEMKTDEFNFIAAEIFNDKIGSASFGGYNLTADDYTISGITNAFGSAYSNVTYTVILNGNGNFAGTKEITWTIKAPTGSFGSSSQMNGVGGIYAGTTLTLTNGCDYYAYEDGKWTAGITVKYPDISAPWTSFFRPQDALFMVDGEMFTAENTKNGVSCDTASSVKTYMKSFTYKTGFTASELEEASGAYLTNSVAACALVWNDGIYGNASGIKGTDFHVVAKTTDITLSLSDRETCDIGATVLKNVKINLAAGAKVTSTVAQSMGNIFTTTAGYKISEKVVSDVYTFECVEGDHDDKKIVIKDDDDKNPEDVEKDGSVTLIVESNRSEDVEAGNLVSTNCDVVIVNESENELSVGAVVAGGNVTITNQMEAGSIVAERGNIVSSNNVMIVNNGYLDADVSAEGNITIYNGSVHTLFGSYFANGSLDLDGGDGAALGDVTLSAVEALTLTGTNVIVGSVNISGGAVTNKGHTVFSVANGNAARLNDFNLIATNDMEVATFGIEIDAAQATGATENTYLLARNASEAYGQVFELIGGSINTNITVDAQTMTIGEKEFTLALNGTDLKLTIASIKPDPEPPEPTSYVVTFNMQGHGVALEPQLIEDGSCVVKPIDPVEDGWVFDGWYTDSACLNVYDFAMPVTSSFVLYAKWTEIVDPVREVTFTTNTVMATEGETIAFGVLGGLENRSTAVTLTFTKGTYSSKPTVYVDGKKAKFPLTLDWARGEVSEKTITLVTKATSKIEEDRFFTLQLSGPAGIEMGAIPVMTVTIRDANNPSESTTDYVRAIAWPAHAGKVSGVGTLKNAKAKRTLKATANKYATFAGWYLPMTNDVNMIDTNALVSTEKSFKVGNGSAYGAGTYYAYFVDVLPVASVIDPDESAETTEGAYYEDGTYIFQVGLYVQLPIGIDDGSGKGTLSVSSLPSGLKYNRKTRYIYGTPTKASTGKSFKVVAKNAAGKQTVYYSYTVEALPANAIGTWNGVVRQLNDPDDGTHAGFGTVQFSATSSGKLSAKVVTRTVGSKSFSSTGYELIDENTYGIEMVGSNGEVFTAKLYFTNDWKTVQLVGSVTGGKFAQYNEEIKFVAIRNAFDKKEGNTDAINLLEVYKSAYSANLLSANDSSVLGTINFSVKDNGKVDVKVKTADNKYSSTCAGAFRALPDSDLWPVNSAAVQTAIRSGKKLFAIDIVLGSDGTLTGLACEYDAEGNDTHALIVE